MLKTRMSKNPDDNAPAAARGPSQSIEKGDREARLAEALRANLRRRKATTRRQKVEQSPSSPRTGDGMTES